MVEYFRRTWQSAIVIWTTLTVEILVSSTIYASLNVAGVSNDTSLLIAFISLIVLIALCLLLFPISLLGSSKENALSLFRLLFRKGREEIPSMSMIVQGDQPIPKNTMATHQRDKLEDYFDKISELLLQNNLRNSEPNAEVRHIARARTLTLLPQLDAYSKGLLIRFLHECELTNVIDLRQSDFREVNLYYANLRECNLFQADLYNANLSNAHLSRANLGEVNFKEANLHEADLRQVDLNAADLSRTDLSGANLSGANLSGANLSRANLSRANLREADLSGADLSRATLSRTDFRGAILNRANFSEVDLKSSLITPDQLNEVSLLTGAIMPDGSKHP